ncbi:hypothetical protein SUGI_1064530 [Cryptomeria japonica]|uniref:non-specific lipid transfer protein GPI-anchored 11 n=1 Tax=Cryptomeria japonica TaxID=3369 RepID=UPI002414A179|nr:non-specific lipid transfer protein GPI-anchored 11 [Cryptomeria japonica]GLJ50050.1 hypothetical protein SUGI_1064530 [Cryptomeria japonica]
MERIAVICFAVMALLGSVIAETPAPSPTSDCLSYITTLAPCLKFVTTPTNQTKPDKDCCTALSTVVSTKVTCLCLLLDPSNSLGLQINITQALALPAACNVKTPSVSQCNAAAPGTSKLTTPVSSPTASSPVISPVMSPAESPAMSPAKSPAMSPLLSPATAPVMSPTVSPVPSPASSLASSPSPVSSPPALVPSSAPVTGGTAQAPGPGSTVSTPPSPKSPATAPGAQNAENAGTIFAPSAIFVLVGLALATFQW